MRSHTAAEDRGGRGCINELDDVDKQHARNIFPLCSCVLGMIDLPLLAGSQRAYTKPVAPTHATLQQGKARWSIATDADLSPRYNSMLEKVCVEKSFATLD